MRPLVGRALTWGWMPVVPALSRVVPLQRGDRDLCRCGIPDIPASCYPFLTCVLGGI
jgi:hypothetical protein